MRRGALLGLAWLLGCGGATPAPAGTPAPSGAAVSGTAPAASAQAPTEAWTCGGDLVPPTGWQQDTAFADASTPEARERAAQAASAKLEKRLCQGDAATCPALRARISTWKTGANDKQVCAMAVVKAEDLEAWRRDAVSLPKLDADLGRAVDELLPKAARGKRLAIDRLIDSGIPGGERADWLRRRLEPPLTKASSLVDLPRGWAGEGLPKGVDLVLRGELVARSEGHIRVLEASLRVLGAGGKVVGAARVTFPEAAAPGHEIAAAAGPETTKGLYLHADTHQGGSLCVGEKTQLWLESEADAYVRVFDLYGAEALQIWPDEGHDGRVAGGKRVALGGDTGFDVIPAPGVSAERFIVVAAPSAAALGRFAGVTRSCRMPAAVAAELHQGRGLPPGVKVATDGYRLVTEGCKGGVSAEQREAQAKALAGLPECAVR